MPAPLNGLAQAKQSFVAVVGGNVIYEQALETIFLWASLVGSSNEPAMFSAGFSVACLGFSMLPLQLCSLQFAASLGRSVLLFFVPAPCQMHVQGPLPAILCLMLAPALPSCIRTSVVSVF